MACVGRREILGMAPRGRQVTFYRTLTIFLLSLNDFIVIRTIKIGIGNRLNVQDLKFQIDPISYDDDADVGGGISSAWPMLFIYIMSLLSRFCHLRLNRQ